MPFVFSRLLAGRGRIAAIRAISTLGAAPLFLGRQPLRCDEKPHAVSTPYLRQRLPVSPRAINQFATGSLAGLCAGIVLRLLSPFLALISSVAAIAFLVASRYGITSKPIFQGIMRASRIGHWDETGEKFVFKVTFVTTLVLATFVHF